MPGLGASFGRGAATTYQQDLANSDCILIMGSNMAEAHPVAFRFALKARELGARLIHIDPRFSRTSALADTHIPRRPDRPQPDRGKGKGQRRPPHASPSRASGRILAPSRTIGKYPNGGPGWRGR